jgi:hypothetical protein
VVIWNSVTPAAISATRGITERLEKWRKLSYLGAFESVPVISQTRVS